MSWLGMSLGDIERNYGCVAEYNRSRREDEEHEAELRYQAEQQFKKNKENLDAAAKEELPIIFYGGYSLGCDKCEYADTNTCLSFDDDIGRVICRNPNVCDAYRVYRAKEIAFLALEVMEWYDPYEAADNTSGDKEVDAQPIVEDLLSKNISDCIVTFNEILTSYNEQLTETSEEVEIESLQSQIIQVTDVINAFNKFIVEGK